MSLVIFDVDGVLEKEEKLIQARYNKLMDLVCKLNNINLKQAKDKYKEIKNNLPIQKRNTSAYIFKELGLSRNKYFEIIDSVNPKKLIEPHNNCLEILETLSKKNVLVTYSNTPKKALINTLKAIKAESYFKNNYSAENFEESKPSIKNLKKIMEKEGFKIKDTVLIGNSLEKDIIPPHKLGIKVILFDQKNKYIKVKEADYVIKDLKEIMNILSN